MGQRLRHEHLDWFSVLHFFRALGLVLKSFFFGDWLVCFVWTGWLLEGTAAEYRCNTTRKEVFLFFFFGSLTTALVWAFESHVPSTIFGIVFSGVFFFHLCAWEDDV
jgi:hypothetical protein